MNAQEAKRHMEDIRNEYGLLQFHEQTLIRKIELLKPKFESAIARAPGIRGINSLSADKLETEVIPCNLANIETIKAREDYFNTCMELAQVMATKEAKKDLFESYKTHVTQEIVKQGKPCTEEMIFAAFDKVKQISNLSPEESTAVNELGQSMIKTLNSGNDARWELYETLQNIIAQHK